ncbi:MAG: L-threonylcarbamoyladenylate synthase [Promethearchaeota archaeon]
MGFLIRLTGKSIDDIRMYLEHAVEQIIDGKLIAFPTNSVYGIGGDPYNLQLIERIYSIKFRDQSKGLLLLIADIEEAKKIAEFNEIARRLADKYWPGQLTLILKRIKSCTLPLELTAFKETIGLRVPENPYLLEILRILKSKGYFGGIIGTSANFSGDPPAISGAEVAKSFLGIIDFIIDAGKSESQIATTIVDCTNPYLKFLRIGKIKKKKVLDFLQSREEGGKRDEKF